MMVVSISPTARERAYALVARPAHAVALTRGLVVSLTAYLYINASFAYPILMVLISVLALAKEAMVLVAVLAVVLAVAVAADVDGRAAARAVARESVPKSHGRFREDGRQQRPREESRILPTTIGSSTARSMRTLIVIARKALPAQQSRLLKHSLITEL